ncbi:MAG TPA: hypothetical protein V6C57_07760 [Coleofasciculaceae cyanobacterium]
MKQTDLVNWEWMNWNCSKWDCPPWDWLSWLTNLMRCCQPKGSPLRSRSGNRQLLLLGSLLILMWGYGNAAQAEAVSSPNLPSDGLIVASNPADSDRLAIPADAADIPVGAADGDSELPPPPALVAPSEVSQADPPADPPQPDPPQPDSPQVDPPQASQASPSGSSPAPLAAMLLQSVKTKAANPPVELAFNLSPAPVPPARSSVAAASPVVESAPDSAASTRSATEIPLDQLFIGNSESLVARAVGSAEGTRTPTGDRNPAYYGHVDPGNKAWNLGSFSYQHAAASPEEADAKQLSRLQDQAAVMQAKAQAQGLTLTTEEVLNGIDLANQAPKAVLDQDGYIEWLSKAHEQGLSGSDAVLWARTQSFLDPNTQQWNAPGLGNTQDSIAHDQQRRMQAIDRALAAQPVQPVQSTQAAQPVQPPAQPTPPIASASLHKIPEDIGIARLFTQQMVTRWGSSAAPSNSVAWSAPGVAAAQPHSSQPDPKATVAEPLGIDHLLSLDLPAS